MEAGKDIDATSRTRRHRVARPAHKLLPFQENSTMKYLCLAYEEERKLNELSQAEWDDLRQETLDYVAGLQQRGQLVLTNALQSARTAHTVRIQGGRRAVTDGPFAETKEQIGGFFLIEATSEAEALDIAAGWPSARIGTIEVRPIEETLRLDSRY